MPSKTFIENTDINIEEQRVCKFCGNDFIITDLEKKNYLKHRFKFPEHCPTCNFKILNSYLNDKHLYNRIDSRNGKNIISTFSPDYSGKVIEAKDYKKFILDDGGFLFKKELSEDIFKDFFELYSVFPKPSRLIYPSLENADYSSHVGRSKNLYLSYCVFTDCEDVYYSFRVLGGSKTVFNSYNILKSSNIYSSRNVGNSFNVFFCDTVIDSSDLLYCNDMNNSSNCIFCCNQLNSKYKIFNRQYTKQEYKAIEKDIRQRLKNKAQSKELINKYEEFLEKNLVKEAISTNRNHKVVGESVYDSKNSYNVHICNSVESSINTMMAGDSSDDKIVNIINSIELGVNCENAIGSISFGTNVYNIFFSFGVSENSKNIYYSYDIESCEEIMFCIGLKSKKYCILNKQYEKQEYFKLKEKIITKLISENKWGDSLGLEFKKFPYNDTLAYDYFKVNKIIYFDGNQEIIDKNATGTITVLEDKFTSNAILDLGGEKKIKIKWRTKSKEININGNIQTLKAKDLPNIDEVEDDILNKAIICKETKRPFRIIKPELEFLRKKELPLPEIHHELRIEKLVDARPFGELFEGVCDKCKKICPTAFKQKPNYKIYCEECYKEYMYN